jgi:hypothetical protein
MMNRITGYGVRIRLLSVAVLFSALLPAAASNAIASPEVEPNEKDSEAMALSPGARIEGAWSYGRSKETRRGTDRDAYRLGGFTYPGTYTITVTPSVQECRYWSGITNFQGPFTGESSVTVTVDQQKKVTVVYAGGGNPDYRTTGFVPEPLNRNLFILEPSLWNSDFQGGFQCVRDGQVYQEIPYVLTVSGDGVSIAAAAPPAPAAGASCRNENEPNDRDEEAMAAAPGTCVDGSWSYSRSKETRRGTDRDAYLLGGFTYPGSYTFALTPSAKDCRYWFGITNLQGPFAGAASITVTVDQQKRVTTVIHGGGRPDATAVGMAADPLNDNRLILEPALWNSDHQGGFQCVKDGPGTTEIPYRLTITSGSR